MNLVNKYGDILHTGLAENEYGGIIDRSYVILFIANLFHPFNCFPI